MKRCGMSMIEITIGVILLALILVPSLNVITTKTQTVNSTRDHAQAAFIAQNIIEQCRSYKFDLIEEDHQTDEAKKSETFEHKLKAGDFDQTLNNIKYSVIKEESDVVGVKKKNANSSSTESKEIYTVWLVKIALEYTGQDGKEHTFDVSTAISQRE